MRKKNKQRFVPQLHDYQTPRECDFELVSQCVASVKEEDIVTGLVVGIESGIVIVDVGLKNEGKIGVQEFALSIDAPLPKIGDRIPVCIKQVDGKNGQIVLSRERAIKKESLLRLIEAHKNGERVNGIIFGRIKGGFTVDLFGVVAFLPKSQVDVRPIDVCNIMETVQQFMILKIDGESENVVISRKAVVEQDLVKTKDEILAAIKVGDIMTGVVKNITDYGAFVDLGSIDGLIHITDMSWKRINHPCEILRVGQEITVVVIKCHQDTRKVSLGIKQLEPNPWEEIKANFPVGAIKNGEVTNITDYGIFVNLNNGIEGLVHASEIGWKKSEQLPYKFKIGQVVMVVIVGVDVEKYRVSLSIKQCNGNAISNFEKQYLANSVVDGEVTNITDSAVFVRILQGNGNINGVINKDDSEESMTVVASNMNIGVGSIVKCMTLLADFEKECMVLRFKPADITTETNEGGAAGPA